MSGRFAVRLLLISLLTTAAGCARQARRPSLWLPPPKESGLKEFRIYDGLDVVLQGHLLPLTRDLRIRLIENREQDLDLTPEQAAADKAQAEKEWTDYADFLLSAFTPKRSWNDFDRTDPHWNVVLLDNTGSILRPEKIAKEDLDVVMDSYPVTTWNETYRVRFLRPKENGAPLPDERLLWNFKMVIAGEAGRAEISW